MAKLFSTKTHGILDYLTAGQLMALPRMLGWSQGVTQWMTGMGFGTLVYSLVTRYEYGPLKLLPMKGHLAIDVVNGLTFCAAPLIFPDEDTNVKAALVGIGLFEIMAALSTETEPSYSEQLRQATENIPDTIGETGEIIRDRAVGA